MRCAGSKERLTLGDTIAPSPRSQWCAVEVGKARGEELGGLRELLGGRKKLDPSAESPKREEGLRRFAQRASEAGAHIDASVQHRLGEWH